MYETFPHTADLGLRIRAADIDTLMAEAGRALFSAMVTNLEVVSPVEQREYRIDGDDREYLLFDWLNELLFTYHRDRLVLADFRVGVDAAGLTGACAGEPLDMARHQLDHDIKAITYHGLKVVESEDLWLAEVIVDI